MAGTKHANFGQPMRKPPPDVEPVAFSPREQSKAAVFSVVTLALAGLIILIVVLMLVQMATGINLGFKFG